MIGIVSAFILYSSCTNEVISVKDVFLYLYDLVLPICFGRTFLFGLNVLNRILRAISISMGMSQGKYIV